MTARPRRPRRRGRAFVWTLAGVLLVAVAGAVWVGARGALAYGHLRAAESAAAAARAQLGDPTAASAALDRVIADTGAARALTGDPVWRAAEALPWLGPQLAAFSTVTASIDDAAQGALKPLAAAASGFSVDALAPRDGRIDVAALAGLAGPAADGAAGLARTAAAVDDIPREPLLAPVRDAVDGVGRMLDETATAADALARTTVLLPGMLGADGPRQYLVLFQNNAEWRSLGGIAGAMALIRTDHGALTLAAQDSGAAFAPQAQSVLPLDDDVRSVYGQRPGKWMLDVTQVPDFTVSASLAREFWARKHGTQVDGVIALDPVALSYLLTATGPVDLPTGDRVTSSNAVRLLLSDVYARYDDPAEQDAFFAGAAAAVFEALAAGHVDPTALVAALGRAGDEHRLLLWSAHADDQARIADTTLAGRLPVQDAHTSRFGVYVNDGTGSKMDYYQSLDTALEWDGCRPDPRTGDAAGSVRLTVTVRNDAPADPDRLPDYVTGTGAFGVTPGHARTVGYVYLPPGFELTDATLSTGDGFGGGTHDGRRVVSFRVELAPGESATAVVTARAARPSPARVEALVTPTLQTPRTPSAVCG